MDYTNEDQHGGRYSWEANAYTNRVSEVIDAENAQREIEERADLRQIARRRMREMEDADAERREIRARLDRDAPLNAEAQPVVYPIDVRSEFGFHHISVGRNIGTLQQLANFEHHYRTIGDTETARELQHEQWMLANASSAMQPHLYQHRRRVDVIGGKLHPPERRRVPYTVAEIEEGRAAATERTREMSFASRQVAPKYPAHYLLGREFGFK